MASRADNANRANASLGGSTPSDGGSAWVDPSANWSVTSNEFLGTNLFAWTPAYLETSTTVGRVSFVVRSFGNSGFGHRYTDANNCWILQVLSNQLGLYKRVSGTFTTYGSVYNGTISAGDTIEVEVTSGNVWTVKQNGTLRINPGTADSAHSTATKLCLANYSGSCRYDDLVFTDTAGGGGTVHDVNLTESASASDAAVSALTAVALLTEAATATDSQTTVAVQTAALTETLSIADAVTAAVNRVVALTEAASLVDLQAAVSLAVAAVAEAATATDEVSTDPTTSAALTETASPADAITCAALLVGAVAESIAAADVVARTAQLVALLTEAATATDTVSGVAPTVYNVSITELAAALDVVSAILSGDSLEHVYLVSRIVQQVLATSLLARQVSLMSPIEQDIDSQSNI